MSGVQVDHSPAVATHSLDISSWNDADLSALNSSEKKRYYRRKSAVQEYFTTEESLSEIASRYHLPVRMMDKLVKRCTMQHEDGTPWGYRALVPGVTVIDHTPAPVPAPSNDATLPSTEEADGEGKAHDNEEANRSEGAHHDREADADNDATRTINAADGTEAHDDHAATPTTSTDYNSEEADADNEATSTAGTDHDGREADADNVASPRVGTHHNSGQADADYTADTDDDSGQADAINRVPTEPEPTVVDDAVGTRLIASAPLSTPLSDSPCAPAFVSMSELASASPPNPVSSLVDGSDDDDADTSPREAIVLPQQSPSLVDDMPDIMGIEETDGGNPVIDNVEDRRDDAEETLPGEDALAVSEQQVKPVVVESAVDTMGIGMDIGANARTPLPDVSRGDSGSFFMPELASRDGRNLVVYERMLPAALPRTSKKHIAITAIDKRTIIAKRSIRRRWVRSEERTRKRKTSRLIGAAVVAVLLLSLLIPLGAGIAAYSAYNSIKGIALDGVSHLLAVKTLLPVSKSDLTAVLDPAKLQQANADFMQAESDFLQLQQLINRQDIQSLVQQFAPQYSNKLGMAERLVQVGIDVTRMGSELIGIGRLGANILHGSPLAAGSTKPLLTVADVSEIEGTMLHALYYIQDIKAQMSQVSLSQLPISPAQQREIASAMTLLPKAQNYIQQGQSVIGIVSWLLGVGHARRFLVQTMDRAELRPSGGFTGQYGVFTIQDGRMAPFTLQDVTELDYNGNGAELGRQAPPGYTSWMNFGNFGLRDANLSGDYPTSARLAMQVFQDEGGGPVDGDIMFTPAAIVHVLDIIGPLKIPAYNDTITAQNLEDKLHYYQNDPTAIALQREKTGTHNAATRKSFTALVGSTLLSTVRHLPVKTLMKIAQNAIKDIQARDLEIYFNNPLAEGWLVAHGYSGAMSTFSNGDGFMVVQSNISISKASTDVQTTEQDNIVLDAQGGATHNLTITLDYEGTRPIYSVYTTYADYIRVYAPANAVLEGGYGFDTGKALCTPPPVSIGNPGDVKPPPSKNPPCSEFTSSYSSNALYCPSGNYRLGPRGWVEGKGYSNWSLDQLGGPTELTSDLPGRAMWGGLTVTPKNCISTITLTWYVPNVVKHVVGQPLYAVLVQKQGGYAPIVQISIDTSQLKGVKPYSFNGTIYADRLFSLPGVKKGK